MQPERIASLLAPFLASDPLSPLQLEQVANHLDLLLRWNDRISLTSLSDPEEIVTRHFGESFFLAQTLFPAAAADTPAVPSAIDLGSGAGFPGLPLKVWLPELSLTLIESHNKKAVFLKEVIRKNRLMSVDVFCGRAEAFASADRLRAGLVTMRAVERFERSLPFAAQLAAPRGCLALLIGTSQVNSSLRLLPKVEWKAPIPVPLSHSRVLCCGRLA